MDHHLFQQFAKKTEQLIALCEQLKQENAQLRANEQQWREERVYLIEKNEIARTKVEAMITRLRTLEQES
ncbi:TIGR02449 family protein [Spartinivicinus ruber]|uniref:TIGR02449 family protein n=1 Tax=Spartinivicinus ruber TaxID=2683272 RepID=UPI0013D68D02|nr:TIGR02449 family protein [Spartinivicinus ruber]